MDEWIEIRDLARKGVSVSEIARRTGRDRKTVRQAMAAGKPKEERKRGERTSKLDPYREYLERRIEEGCLNGVVLLDEITKQGYDGKISIVRDVLTPIRAELARKREATERYETGPGKQAQVDWAEFGKIWVPAEEQWRKLYAFVYTLGYSRAQTLEFTVGCDMEHFLECHVQAFAARGIADTILYDNLKTGIVGRRADGTPIFPGRFLDFALAHGFTPTFCRVRRPQTKGKVERTVGYVRQNFWVRVAHEIAEKRLDLNGLNERAHEWVETVADQRVHATHGEVVAVRYAREAPLLGTLVGRPRYDTAYHSVRHVGRDGRLSYRGTLYQLPLAQAKSAIEVREGVDGAVMFRTGKGALIRVAEVTGDLVPAAVAPGLPHAELRAATHLTLLYPEAPQVELRDLSIYEEVAYAASR
ncbi:MAG: IS21 family transposase [Chloroflexota bacterium]